MTTDLRCTETFDNHAAAAAASPLMTAASFRGGVAYSQPIVCRAYKDPVILEDARVFQNMLDIEEFYVAATNYFAHTQTEIKPHMRKIVTDWMLEVCMDQNCHADVFLLACNIMDRFLNTTNIRKNQFQLVAASTIFIGSKLVDPCPISAQDLIKYTDHTYTITELLEMELLILSKLKWDLSALTPYDFLEYLVRLLAGDDGSLDTRLLRRHTENFIVLCATEFRFSMYPPSMLSSAALAAAASNLGAATDLVTATTKTRTAVNEQPFHSNQLVKQLQLLTRVDNDCLAGVIRQIEETFQAATASVNNTIIQSTTSPTTMSSADTANRSNSSPTKVVNNNNAAASNAASKAAATEASSPPLDNEAAAGGEGRESQTPTEVFRVDWMCIA